MDKFHFNLFICLALYKRKEGRRLATTTSAVGENINDIIAHVERGNFCGPGFILLRITDYNKYISDKRYWFVSQKAFNSLFQPFK
jgi:hypothetical protein